MRFIYLTFFFWLHPLPFCISFSWFFHYPYFLFVYTAFPSIVSHFNIFLLHPYSQLCPLHSALEPLLNTSTLLLSISFIILHLNHKTTIGLYAFGIPLLKISLAFSVKDIHMLSLFFWVSFCHLLPFLLLHPSPSCLTPCSSYLKPVTASFQHFHYLVQVCLMTYPNSILIVSFVIWICQPPNNGLTDLLVYP